MANNSQTKLKDFLIAWDDVSILLNVLQFRMFGVLNTQYITVFGQSNFQTFSTGRTCIYNNC